MLPESQIEELIVGVFEGVYSPENLPEFLYVHTATELIGSVMAGFGQVPKGDIKLEERAQNYRLNISRFSGSKNFQEVKELSDYVFDENGKKRNFVEFRTKALGINDRYNVTWLRTEQDTAFLQSQNARKWLKAEAEQSVFPFLEYVTVGDDRTRRSHAKLNGLKARVNDPIWNKIHPQNGWRCRCIVIQHESVSTSTKAEIEDKTRLMNAEFRKNSEFEFNPGKIEYIFKESGKGKHDYFKVPRKYQEDLKNNFGFETI